MWCHSPGQMKRFPQYVQFAYYGRLEVVRRYHHDNCLDCLSDRKRNIESHWFHFQMCQSVCFDCNSQMLHCTVGTGPFEVPPTTVHLIEHHLFIIGIQWFYLWLIEISITTVHHGNQWKCLFYFFDSMWLTVGLCNAPSSNLKWNTCGKIFFVRIQTGYSNVGRNLNRFRKLKQSNVISFGFIWIVFVSNNILKWMINLKWTK